MKISELARASGISVTTLRFYVKEGLIRPACKTGRNMAYYDPSCVSTVGVIRLLQRERFYPLSVIKRLLETSPPGGVELELLDAIHKVDYQSSGELVSLSEAVRRSRLTAPQIGVLHATGLVVPRQDGRKKLFSTTDLSVMALVRRRMDAGIPFAQSVRSFGIYEKALREAVQADVDALAAALMAPDFTAEAGAQMIRTSDETLDAFVALRRKALNREFGSRRLEDLDRFEQALTAALSEIGSTLAAAGLDRESARCAAVLESKETGLPALDKAAAHYWSIARSTGGDIARSIAESVRSRSYFCELQPDGEGELTTRCLQVSWLTLAPAILDCGEAARDARCRLAARLQEQIGSESRALLGEIDGILSHTGGNT
ncbi:MAG: MerR family transcriptional regulator [Oscillospiraceae bacterium]|nr:MerR family transcriptional regulator [Oscillospiraceae bacterium]